TCHRLGCRSRRSGADSPDRKLPDRGAMDPTPNACRTTSAGTQAPVYEAGRKHRRRRDRTSQERAARFVIVTAVRIGQREITRSLRSGFYTDDLLLSRDSELVNDAGMKGTICVFVFIFGLALQAQAQFSVRAASDEAVAGWQQMPTEDNKTIWVSP